MQLKPINAILLTLAATLSLVLASTTAASAHSAPGSGFHDSAPLRSGPALPFRHGGTFGASSVAWRNKRPRHKSARVAGVYPWNDPRWRYRLHGVPDPYCFYQPVCGVERMPYGVVRKLRSRRAYRRH
jgi:hypothetical protein